MGRVEQGSENGETESGREEWGSSVFSVSYPYGSVQVKKVVNIVRVKSSCLEALLCQEKPFEEKKL